MAVCGCGGSGSSDPLDAQGDWRGSVAYDVNSCSSPLLSPDSVASEFRITVTDDIRRTDRCPSSATDQYGQRYVVSGPPPCPIESDTEVVFIPEQDEVGGPSPTRPTGIIFYNIHDRSADVAVSYFIDFSIGGTCALVFRGRFARQ